MKFYSISVNEDHARAVIINHLTLLDFYNFEITGVQEVGDIGD